jgi:alcohol dehydrogenase (cytochrome c)
MRPIVVAVLLAGSIQAQNPVTSDRLVNALKEPENWLTYWGDYSGIRHRELNQINTSNVKDLRLEWMFQTGVSGSFQAVPLVVNGVMYFTGGEGTAFAIDAKTGRQLWRYKYPLPEAKNGFVNGTVNRGLSILGQLVFMAVPNAHVVALDIRTGKLVWEAEMADYTKGYGATVATLVVKDKVIVGITGGEYGIRGFVDAFDAATGKRAWRFYTIPAKGEPGNETWAGESWRRGGGATWLTGTYDPELNLLYWPVGNPGPDLYGKERAGDNLYTDSIVALDPDTGKLKWHYQFTPHDTHDWDANETPMLLDLDWQGKPRKLLLQANRNGFFYVLDRVTGEFLSAKPFARQTWAQGFDKKGRPILKGETEPSPEGNRQCPGLAGSTNWMASSYNPQTGLFYFAVRETCDVFYSSAPKYIEGKPFWGSVFRGVTEEREWGMLKALDPLTGETKWDFRYDKAPWAGTLSTSGGLVFAADEDGYLMAADAKTGKILWRIYTGTRLSTSPITFMLDGRQYLTMGSGAAVMTFALPK